MLNIEEVIKTWKTEDSTDRKDEYLKTLIKVRSCLSNMLCLLSCCSHVPSRA